MAFDQSLGRDTNDSTESLADWWLFGARSLVWPAILSVVVIISGRLLITVWRGLLQVIPGLEELAASSVRWRCPRRETTGRGRSGRRARSGWFCSRSSR